MSPLGTITTFSRQEHELDNEKKFDLIQKQGKPVFTVEMRIVNDAGRELQNDGKTSGHVQVRGPYIVGSYYKVIY